MDPAEPGHQASWDQSWEVGLRREATGVLPRRVVWLREPSHALPIGPALKGLEMTSSCLTNLAKWAPGLWGCGLPCVIQHLEPFHKLKTIWKGEYPCISKRSSLRKNKEKGK